MTPTPLELERRYLELSEKRLEFDERRLLDSRTSMDLVSMRRVIYGLGVFGLLVLTLAIAIVGHAYLNRVTTMALFQKQSEMEETRQSIQAGRELRASAMKVLNDHFADLADSNTRSRVAALLLASFSPEIASPLVANLEKADAWSQSMNASPPGRRAVLWQNARQFAELPLVYVYYHDQRDAGLAEALAEQVRAAGTLAVKQTGSSG